MNPIYTITRVPSYHDRRYAHLTIGLMDNEVFEHSRPTVEFAWQGNPGEQGASWYAGAMKVEAENPHAFDQGLKLLKLVRISGDITPEAVLSAIGKKRIPRYVYDPRQYPRYLPAEAVGPGARYMDNYKICNYPIGHDHCHVDCIAESEAEARGKLAAEFATRNEKYSERFREWVDAGCPVLVDHYASKAPDVRPLAAILDLSQAD